MTPQPGDFAVIDCRSQVGGLINVAQWLSGGGQTMFNHAVICSGITADGTVMIVEAEPGGARSTAWHYDGYPHEWSTGRVKTSASAGKAALAYAGVPYSFLDYLAIAVHRFLPFLGGPLRRYVASSEHMICSQLVDQACLMAGVHLFADGRWPGYVRPSDLASLILDAPDGA